MDLVTVKELATELGMDRSHLFKLLRSMSLETRPVRPPGTRGSPLSAITQADAERVRSERRRRGFTVNAHSNDAGIVGESSGVFYVIVLDPEMRPNRLKLGYANNVQERLASHRTAAPLAKVVGSWPAKRSWETCIVDALTTDAQFVSGEIYDFPSVEIVLKKAKQFMSMLPKL